MRSISTATSAPFNRALSAILGPEKERQKSRKWRLPAEALLQSIEPAIRLAKKHALEDPDAEDFLESLETESVLQGLVPEPKPRQETEFDRKRRYRRIKAEELRRAGVQLARAVAEGSAAVLGDTPEGKRILGLAKSLLEIENKAEPLQDRLPRSPGENFTVPSFEEMLSGSVEGNSRSTPADGEVRSPGPAPRIAATKSY